MKTAEQIKVGDRFVKSGKAPWSGNGKAGVDTYRVRGEVTAVSTFIEWKTIEVLEVNQTCPGAELGSLVPNGGGFLPRVMHSPSEDIQWEN